MLYHIASVGVSHIEYSQSDEFAKRRDPSKLVYNINKNRPHKRDAQVAVFCGSLKYNKANAMQHSRECAFLKSRYPSLFSYEGAAKVISIYLIDSGPDEHCLWWRSAMANVMTFVFNEQALLALFSLAAGYSSVQAHEASQGFVTRSMAGSLYSSSMHGVVARDAAGDPRGAHFIELEKRNHVNCVEKLRAQLEGAQSGTHACVHISTCAHMCAAHVHTCTHVYTQVLLHGGGKLSHTRQQK